jgi:hypothetical protein
MGPLGFSVFANYLTFGIPTEFAQGSAREIDMARSNSHKICGQVSGGDGSRNFGGGPGRGRRNSRNAAGPSAEREQITNKQPNNEQTTRGVQN